MKENKTYLMFITRLNSNMPTVTPNANAKSIKNTDYEGDGSIKFKDLRVQLKFTFLIDYAFFRN